MLNMNKNLFFSLIIYLLVVLIELFHFGSDIYIIIMLESFLCFTALLFVLSFTFQKMFVLGLHLITLKYNYISFFFRNMVNLNVYVYNVFINNFLFFLFSFIKDLRLNRNLTEFLKTEYTSTLIFLKKNFINFSKKFNLVLFV